VNFDWTDEQRMLRESVERFGAQHYLPGARRSLLAHGVAGSRMRWKMMAEFGWLALALPDARGGLGGTSVDVMALMEVFGRHLMLEPYVTSCILAPALLARFRGGSKSMTEHLDGLIHCRNNVRGGSCLIKNNLPSKQQSHHGRRLMAAVVSRLPLLVMALSIFALLDNAALGLNKQLPADNSPMDKKATDKPIASKTLVATEGVEHVDRLAREPMVIELSDGSLFVSGYGGQGDVEKIPDLWRSRDHGATWERVNVGRNADGAIGNTAQGPNAMGRRRDL